MELVFSYHRNVTIFKCIKRMTRHGFFYRFIVAFKCGALLPDVAVTNSTALWDKSYDRINNCLASVS